MMRILLFLTLMCASQNAFCKTYRVLFIGNSYTAVNNLPQLLQQVGASVGDTFLTDANTPGGYTFQGHSTDATTLGKIAIGNWDYIVLQEQSQRPAFSDAQVAVEVFPYARILDSMIHAQNSCAQTLFYMTWGRKNGDASNCAVFPPICTYLGMDSLLRLRYELLADTNDAVLSPVGAVWRHLRSNNPLIELYQADESHPTLSGSYAAALSFYTAITQNNPQSVPFSSTLPAADAAAIRAAVKAIVFDSMAYWHIGQYDPAAAFTASVNAGQLIVQNNAQYATNFVWYFGDGSTDTAYQPTHVYAQPGTYTVSLVATHCGKSDTQSQQITVVPTSLTNLNGAFVPFEIYPNPAQDVLSLQPNSGFYGSASTISLVDCLGRRVWQEQTRLTNHPHVISLSGLPPGIYLIRVAIDSVPTYQAMFTKQ